MEKDFLWDEAGGLLICVILEKLFNLEGANKIY